MPRYRRPDAAVESVREPESSREDNERENSFRAQLFMSISCRNLQYSSAKASNSLPKISKEASFNSTECFSTRQAFNSDSSFSLKQETQRGRTVSVRRNVVSI
ncbi:hypothetical protein EYF80_043478 [Liparis tanakae]|uniref:Uncharacterized protein n=1 Tax=Liparis tanakae TaxID=230148 RepID=A0A4Z2FYL0_9TELE|nr:hypothetical protein EYF80_043478 [Liparis tanakae]